MKSYFSFIALCYLSSRAEAYVAPTCAAKGTVCKGPGLKDLPCCDKKYECTSHPGSGNYYCDKIQKSTTTTYVAPTCAAKGTVCKGPGLKDLPCCDKKYECTSHPGSGNYYCDKIQKSTTTTYVAPTCAAKGTVCKGPGLKDLPCCDKNYECKSDPGSGNYYCDEKPKPEPVYGILGPVRLSVNVSNNYADDSAPLVTKCAQKYFDEAGTARVNFTEEACNIVNYDNTTNWFIWFKQDDINDMNAASHFSLVNGLDQPCLCNNSKYTDPVVQTFMSKTVNEPVEISWPKDIDGNKFTSDFNFNNLQYTKVNEQIDDQHYYKGNVLQFEDTSKYMNFAYGPYPDDFTGADTKQGNQPSEYQFDKLAMYSMTFYHF